MANIAYPNSPRSLAGHHVAVLYTCHECFKVLLVCRHTCLCITQSDLLPYKWLNMAEAEFLFPVIIMSTISRTHEFADDVYVFGANKLMLC
jgi:hypothetical protein